MIISRTPFRVSFFGGGTDYPEWYKNNKGSVISTTINKFSYINVRVLPPFFKYKYCIRYFKREERNKIQQIQHPSVRETLKYFGIKDGIEIVHNADLPALSGLGSSSTFTVGLVKAISALQGKMLTKKELANYAIIIEQNKIKEKVGSQDQSAAAFGGFNKIDFMGENTSFVVNPIILDKNYETKLQENLILIFSGLSRKGAEITTDQIKNIKKKSEKYEKMYELVNEAYEILKKRKSVDNFGELLNHQWKLKKTFSDKITNPEIDKIYNKAIKAGAIGGKLLGAGNGGFLLFYARKKNHNKIMNSLKDYLHVPFNFDTTGSQVIYYSKS
tara:strand:+ start:4106 stop:5095 length:990 start_codon:yes stop_codon:yes gene_type:complete